MKNLVLASFVMLSAGSALAASTNYGSLTRNTDGSVTIVQPRFQYNGVNYNLSEHSDYNGVCRLYGFPSAVWDSVATDSGSGRDVDAERVRIGSSGTMAGFDTRSHIYRISCLTGETSAPSRDFGGISRSDDGSVVISDPFYRSGGESLPLSYNSSENGVCKMYGFGSFIEGSLQTKSADSSENEEGRAVVISEAGKYARVNTNGTAIASLACRDNGTPIEAPAPKTEVIELPNGQVRIVNPMVNGLPVSRHSGADAVCIAFGYEGGALRHSNTRVGKNVELNDSGAVVDIRDFGIGYSMVECAR